MYIATCHGIDQIIDNFRVEISVIDDGDVGNGVGSM